MYWYELNPKERSIVLSTRVRFARNLEAVLFPHVLKEEERAALWDKIRSAFAPLNPMAVSFSDVDQTVKDAYVQTRLASPLLAKKSVGSGLLLSRDGAESIMVNEEDHLRLQVILPGKAIEEAVERALNLANKAEELLPIAKRDGLGYLTACPTNLGEGMRLSVMIHLPALRETGAMNGLIRRLSDAGFTVRGLFGEGSGESGAVYQISNQMSREKKAAEIAENFSRLLSRVEEMETKAREDLLRQKGLEAEDRVMRAFGTLLYARKMSYSEFITLYSRVRFGLESGMDLPENAWMLDRLFTELSPAPMVLRDATLSHETARDEARCRILRETLLKGEQKNGS